MMFFFINSLLNRISFFVHFCFGRDPILPSLISGADQPGGLAPRALARGSPALLCFSFPCLVFVFVFSCFRFSVCVFRFLFGLLFFVFVSFLFLRFRLLMRRPHETHTHKHISITIRSYLGSRHWLRSGPLSFVSFYLCSVARQFCNGDEKCYFEVAFAWSAWGSPQGPGGR